MYKYLVFFLLFHSSFAQDKKALFYLDQGEKEFKLRKYAEALNYFEKYFERDSSSQLAYIRSAQIYESFRNTPKAIFYYNKATRFDLEKVAYPQAYIYLGTRELELGNYENAKKYLEIGLKFTNPSALVYKQIQHQLKNAQLGIDAMANPLHITPEKLPDIINFREKQYFPILTADGNTLIFTAISENNDENLYISKYGNGNWQEPMQISDHINTPNNEGTSSISADGRILVFTSCEGRKSLGSCDLYISHKQGDIWSEPENLGPNINSSHWDSQPSLSADGSTLYFSSDRPNGFGKKDIWMSQLDKNGQWSRSVNVGSAINTPKDEVSPFIHANGYSLFYSSNGHDGLGSFDIYLTNLKEGNDARSINLGYPINTAGDESGLFISADGKTALYARQEEEKTSIFKFDIPQELSSQFDRIFYLKGVVGDSKTKKPLSSTLELIDKKSGRSVSKFLSDPINGHYLTVIPDKDEYLLYIKSPGYFFKRLDLNYSENNNNLDILLDEIVKEDKVTLDYIFFDTGSATLRKESTIALQKLQELLQQNPKLKVEISGHTDDVGNDASNLELSNKRAQAVVDYLIKEGINSNRMIAKGYGESQPKIKNNSEFNRQQNRRIELKVL